MNGFDPKISVEYALSKTNGNQAELGRLLGVTRASVNEWLRTDREFLPELQAHRFLMIFGDDKAA